ncbi:P-loop containing nucleoside triphosphate hydrolase protein [Peniophora sp. CONT]|nr:P-loop containing nucleoside triphosphate hydrolase protein [Peniophora sp. CONT]
MAYQVVLNVHESVFEVGSRVPLWRDARILPAYAAILSACAIVLHFVLLHFRQSSSQTKNRSRGAARRSLASHIKEHGGVTIFGYKVARSASVLALFVIHLVGSIGYSKGAGSEERGTRLEVGQRWVDLVLCLAYCYALSLSLATLWAKARVARIISLHLSLVLLSDFVVYAYRDLWPLLTVTLSPLDQAQGGLLWANVALVTFSAVLVPLPMPRQYVPLNPQNPQAKTNPEQTASALSFLTFSFLDPYIFGAYRQESLDFEQFPVLCDYDYTTNLVKRSFKHLDRFSGAPAQHMFFALLKIFSWEFTAQVILLTLHVLGNFLAPVGINRLLNYIEVGGEDALVRPWAWISLMFFGPFLSTAAFQLYLYISNHSLVRVQTIITQLVFEHALRMRMTAETSDSKQDDDVQGRAQSSGNSSNKSEAGKRDGSNLTGRINNLVATDTANITAGRDFLFLVLYSPLQCVVAIYFLYALLGWSALVGLALMVASLPLPGWIASKMQDIQRTAMKKTDARVQTATEMLGVLRMVKLFGWEGKMSARLDKKRDEELWWIMRRKLADLANNTTNGDLIPILQMVATYAVFTLVMKRELTSSLVFSTATVFDLLRQQLLMAMHMLQPVITAKVSLERVSNFLNGTELLDRYTDGAVSSETLMPETAHIDPSVLGFRDASFTWSSDASQSSSRRNFVLRIPDELIFKRGAINLIIGATGCGKTSLLMALLGEMRFVPKTPESWCKLPRAGGVAYAAQESWVLNQTIKDNILFGAAYDEERYDKVLYQCALKRDLALFQAGDETEVGERGLTLSGGQKARITLARAIYSSADVLLLDDVLAALDVHTAKWIVDKCFSGDLVRGCGRTILLVTHNVALTGPVAELVVSFGSDGTLVSRGTVDEVLAKDGMLKHEIEEQAMVIEKTEKELVSGEEPDEEIKQADGKLIVEEDIQQGRVSWSSLRLFISALGGKHSVIFWAGFGVLLAIDNTLGNFQASLTVYWLGVWAEAYAKAARYQDVNATFYLGIAVCIGLGCASGYIGESIVYLSGSVRAAREIHKQLINSILGTTLRVLDKTPVSRILTRCTADTHNVDEPVAELFRQAVEAVVRISFKLAAIVIITPAFLLPSLVVFLIGRYCGQIYTAAQLAVNRVTSVKRAPVLGNFGVAIAGLTSIRAYNAEDAFRREAYKVSDEYMRAARLSSNTNRWIGMRIDALGGLFSAALATYLIYGPGRSALPSDIGFTLNMGVEFSGSILWCVQVINMFEISANSLERIYAYLSLEQEPQPSQESVPPASWPTSGELRVKNLSARYSPEGPRVLHDLSFTVRSGERVGIVGRTGSGKSSLTLSLLRCILTEGSVILDGIDTSNLNLDVLRSNITIIPQVPELLSGTLRENLDPFSEHDDATLNDALRSAGLYALQKDVEETDAARITLETQIASGGGNLSVGQRQVLALSRALIRGSKLLILDEATSSIDYATDAIIQASLRTEIGDVTLLTVAHRLQTIMDADRIMVLDAGRIVEFDAPSVLLAKDVGYFKSLVEESPEKDTLHAMVEGKMSSA